MNGYKVPDIIGECNYYTVEQSWYAAYSDYASKGIHTIFWAFKSTSGGGEDSWGYYNENGWSWGGPEGYDGEGNYPNGSLAALYTPDLLTDTAQTIANDWAAFTTAGTQNAQPGTYPNTPAYQPNFHYNYALGDPITEILQPQTAIADGLLPPVTPPANGVAGVNFGFENPFVSSDADGGDAADFRVNYLPNPQTVSAGWTFTGNCGITSTGLQEGALTGWGRERHGNRGARWAAGCLSYRFRLFDRPNRNQRNGGRMDDHILRRAAEFRVRGADRRLDQRHADREHRQSIDDDLQGLHRCLRVARGRQLLTRVHRLLGEQLGLSGCRASDCRHAGFGGAGGEHIRHHRRRRRA